MRIFPDPEPVTQVCAIRARNSVPDAGLSDVLTPRRQGVFLRLCSCTAGRGADNRYAAQRVLWVRAGIPWVAVRPGG